MGYTVHGILQARILEWLSLLFFRGSSQPRDQTQVSHIEGGFFTSWATRVVVFHTFFNFSLNFAVRNSWSEPQSSPGFVFADCIELLYLWLQKTIWFLYWQSGDVLLYSCLLGSWKRLFALTNTFSWKNSISLCSASFCAPGSNLPAILGISRLATFASQAPMMKRTSLFGVNSKRCYASS